MATPGSRCGSAFASASTSALKSAATSTKTAAQLVREAVDTVRPGVVRNYAIEIAVLGVGAASGVGGLKEFCALAALFTSYVVIWNILTQVR
jgi:hydroxymethylglutaryl-CoA reductase (NADPH)